MKKSVLSGSCFIRGILFLGLVFFTSSCQDKGTLSVSSGKKDIRVLLLVSKNYGLNYFLIRDVLDQFGWKVVHTGVLDEIPACPPVEKQLGIHPVIPDVSLSEIDNLDDYDGLVIPPGAGNFNPVPDAFADLLGSPEAMNLIQKAVNEDMPVFAICSGSRVLAAADVLRGKRMVGSPRFVEEYQAAGAVYVGNERNDHPPVIDGNLITGTRGQYYNLANCQAIATLIEERQTGRKKDSSLSDFLVTKDPSFISGENVWAKTYGGEQAEGGRAVGLCPDGGFFITGYTFSQGTGDSDLLVIKTDDKGEMEWSRTYGGAGTEYGNACLCLPDGYLVTGYTSSSGSGSKDVYVIRLDTKGKELWSKTFGGPSWDVGTALCESHDGNLYVGGYTHSFGEGEEDVYLIKIDKNGNKIWSRTFGGERLDMANSISLTEDGGLLIGGTSGSFSNNTDFYLIRTDDRGEEVWSKSFAVEGSRGHAFDWCSAMAGTRDGGAILTGYTDSQDVMDMHVIKTDADGNQVWAKTLGNKPFYDFGNAVLELAEGGYLVAGATKSVLKNKEIYDNDILVMRLDSNGDVVWEKSFGGEGADWASFAVLTGEGEAVVTGHTRSAGSGFIDLLLFKIGDIVD
jgi:putative intracellular protease/amidase